MAEVLYTGSASGAGGAGASCCRAEWRVLGAAELCVRPGARRGGSPLLFCCVHGSWG